MVFIARNRYWPICDTCKKCLGGFANYPQAFMAAVEAGWSWDAGEVGTCGEC